MSSLFRCDGRTDCRPVHNARLATVYSTDEGESDDEHDKEDDDLPNEDNNQGDAHNFSDQDPDEDEEMRSRASSDRMSVDEGSNTNDSLNHDGSNQGREEAPARLRGTETFVKHYPVPTVGEAIREATPEELAARRRSHKEVGPFADEDLFDLIKLLMTSGMLGKKRDQFLKLERTSGATPWSNNREMIIDIDKWLPCGPKWRVKTFEIVGSKGTEYVEFWYRDVLEAILQLLADPQFCEHMTYKPTKEYTSPDCTTRKYGETPASDRMWKLQLAGIDWRYFWDRNSDILCIDETTLTVFVREQKAHPVYVTIGNLAKGIRRQTSKRGMILIGYLLPVTKLECEGNDEKRRVLKSKLFHECMRTLTASLHTAGKEGVEAVCSDGKVRRGYPVFCGAMLDFAEQCMYASIRKPVCPTCEVPGDEQGDLTNYDGRDVEDIRKCMQEHEEDGSARFVELGLMPVVPFWLDLPWVDAGSLFPPDLLHQLYKGVFKDHLLEWSAFALGKDELNNRFKSMSPHHGLRHFKHGVLKTGRWTGREIKEQTRVYLPTMAGQEPEVMACARALIDFIFLAHSSSLTGDDLDRMQQCQEIFHENKHIFPELGALEHGTPDGFNTELPERLHIRDAKEGYWASNKKEVIAQMATHVQRMEAIAKHRAYLKHRANPDTDDPEFGGAEHDEAELQPLGEDEDEDDPIVGDDIIFDRVVRRLAVDEEEEGEEQDLGADERAKHVDEGAVVEGELEEAVDEDEVVLERKDVGDDGTWEDVTFQIEGEDGEMETEDRPSIFHPDPEIRHAKKPTITARGTHLVEKHGSTRLLPALRSFFRREQLALSHNDLPSLNDKFAIWYQCRLLHSPPPFKPSEGPKVDVVRALPAIIDRYGCRRRQAQFDTALYFYDEDGVGLQRFRACRVRAIFELPERLQHIYSDKLVYAELFNEFRGPEQTTGLYTTAYTYDNQARREARGFPLSQLRMTAHIAPHYGTATKELDLSTESDILHSCKKFLFDKYGSFFAFKLMHHWDGVGVLG
ncbi:hypothetical protein FRC09_006092 [Ceratobasidium sp. 395]|nr:hypothetical protein FRC09_006092 [Ceratobasidium sp. 395]